VEISREDHLICYLDRQEKKKTFLSVSKIKMGKAQRKQFFKHQQHRYNVTVARQHQKTQQHLQQTQQQLKRAQETIVALRKAKKEDAQAVVILNRRLRKRYSIF